MEVKLPYEPKSFPNQLYIYICFIMIDWARDIAQPVQEGVTPSTLSPSTKSAGGRALSIVTLPPPEF